MNLPRSKVYFIFWCNWYELEIPWSTCKPVPGWSSLWWCNSWISGLSLCPMTVPNVHILAAGSTKARFQRSLFLATIKNCIPIFRHTLRRVPTLWNGCCIATGVGRREKNAVCSSPCLQKLLSCLRAYFSSFSVIHKKCIT